MRGRDFLLFVVVIFVVVVWVALCSRSCSGNLERLLSGVLNCLEILRTELQTLDLPNSRLGLLFCWVLDKT